MFTILKFFKFIFLLAKNYFIILLMKNIIYYTSKAAITWSGDIVFFACLLQISLDSDAIR